MMENLQGTLETNVSFERVKQKLNKYLIDYLKERSNTPKEAEKKTAFMREFNKFSNDHRRQFRDYLSKILQNDPSIINDIDDDLEQITGLFETMKRIDQLEVYAGVCNNCNTPQTQPLGRDVYGEFENTTQNFERNEIPQNTFELDAGYARGKKEYFFNPERKNIIHKGGNSYEITYSFSHKSGKFFAKSNQETINVQIGESGHHTITNNFSSSSIQFYSPIQNNGNSDIIELNFHDGEKNVTLILSRPNPQQKIYIRH